jgi:hypothetical protein
VAKRLPKEFIARLKSIKAKRPATVIHHILKHGFITNEDLKETYGYHHPPRAIRDVREQGIPIETYAVADSNGRKIAAYRFGAPELIQVDSRTGRRPISKNFKLQVIANHGPHCAFCLAAFEPRYLQIDHRVPYQVSGDPPGDRDPVDFFPVCGSCNRAKSWSCEHCVNWQESRDANVCRDCYWASPTSYSHIAMEQIRRLEIVWSRDEIAEYGEIRESAAKEETTIPDFVKNVLRLYLLGEKRS